MKLATVTLGSLWLVGDRDPGVEMIGAVLVAAVNAVAAVVRSFSLLSSCTVVPSSGIILPGESVEYNSCEDEEGTEFSTLCIVLLLLGT